MHVLYAHPATISIQSNTIIQTPKIRIPTYRWWISENISNMYEHTQTNSESPMHQAIACALVATPARTSQDSLAASPTPAKAKAENILDLRMKIVTSHP